MSGYLIDGTHEHVDRMVYAIESEQNADEIEESSQLIGPITFIQDWEEEGVTAIHMAVAHVGSMTAMASSRVN